jgi:hypothetical protein
LVRAAGLGSGVLAGGDVILDVGGIAVTEQGESLDRFTDISQPSNGTTRWREGADLDREQTRRTGRLFGMGLCNLLTGWFRSVPLDECPACGRGARRHEVRTLARERFAPDQSGIEGHLARGEFDRAAALDDPHVRGDQLVHQLLRCGDRVILVTSEESLVGFEPRIRRTAVLEGDDARAAWTCAA